MPWRISISDIAPDAREAFGPTVLVFLLASARRWAIGRVCADVCRRAQDAAIIRRLDADAAEFPRQSQAEPGGEQHDPGSVGGEDHRIGVVMTT
ncbi:hypothetical protein AB4156_45310, partial [Cupriavidus sp. 2MCAB6]|uniref:hypothetical protein n=1 Tax=Cupriavidus sp. 2MCAB6 TaxID=3232981 RepID=UPI003F92A574